MKSQNSQVPRRNKVRNFSQKLGFLSQVMNALGAPRDPRRTAEHPSRGNSEHGDPLIPCERLNGLFNAHLRQLPPPETFLQSGKRVKRCRYRTLVSVLSIDSPDIVRSRIHDSTGAALSIAATVSSFSKKRNRRNVAAGIVASPSEVSLFPVDRQMPLPIVCWISTSQR